MQGGIVKYSVKLWHIHIALFFLLFLSLPLKSYSLHMTEVSRFAFTTHDYVLSRAPVIDYPYVYLPTTYGFQVSVWDSLAGSFTEVGNYPVDGMASEILKIGDYLFVSVTYSNYTPLTSSSGALFRVDVSDPLSPQAAGEITVGENGLRYFQLRFVNGMLIAKRQENGLLTGLSVIDPSTNQVIQNYSESLYYEYIGNNYIITRSPTASPFTIMSVTSSGLQVTGSITLPYSVGIFPRFIIIDSNTIATQDHNALKLWHVTAPDTWQERASIAIGLHSTSVTYCNNYLIFNTVTAPLNIFTVYDISDLDNPTEVQSQDFPDGLENNPSGGTLISYGDYLFASTNCWGCVNLKVQDTGIIEFVSKCFRFNQLSSVGHKYGHYILQPVMYDGIACFDISDPSNPSHEFSILTDYYGWIDLCGDYMLGQFGDGTTASLRVYNIINLQSPVMIYNLPVSMYHTLFFNYTEPGSFYVLNSQTARLYKYLIVENNPILVFDYPLGFNLQSPVFSGNLLYMCEANATANADLYVFDGLVSNEPYLSHIVPDLVPPPGYVFYAGNYLFLRNNLNPSQPAGFFNPLGSFQVENNIHWGNFGDYVCVSSELGINFYNTEGYPTGFVTPDYYLPQGSYTGHIENDDAYLYFFAQDNVSIYSYTTTDNDDQVAVPEIDEIKCYPNPAFDDLVIEIKGLVDPNRPIKVFNIKGQLIKSITVGQSTSEGVRFVWDGKDNDGNWASSGVYFIRLQAEGISLTHKVLLMK